MKKLALFLGGLLVGWFGFAFTLTKGQEMYDDVLCDNDKYTIKRANERIGDSAVAVVTYK